MLERGDGPASSILFVPTLVLMTQVYSAPSCAAIAGRETIDRSCRVSTAVLGVTSRIWEKTNRPGKDRPTTSTCWERMRGTSSYKR
ncbi:hypothetical protein B0H65DRAFT_463817 [Neurospora tetraspora]|uniref:Secreted protein n=1 Tax=Neurospora tetraspora TaxID=94610 RepID=A0AAE0JDY9_9PEZI|nr:hypothetical protein B0H65DRAFT_463817 [Neurospora tetraspora]